MNNIRTFAAALAVVATIALPFGSANAWWGSNGPQYGAPYAGNAWSGPWNNGAWNNGPWNNSGWNRGGAYGNNAFANTWDSMLGPLSANSDTEMDMDMNLRMRGNFKGMIDSMFEQENDARGNSYYRGQGWQRQGPWTIYHQYQSKNVQPYINGRPVAPYPMAPRPQMAR